MNSLIVDGKVKDFKFTKRVLNSYNFYLGDTLIGTLHKIDGSWTAVSWAVVNEIGPIAGFKTRLDGAIYLLKLGGFIRRM